MHYFVLITLFFLSPAAHAEYTWWDYNQKTREITFGPRYSDFCNDKRTFPLSEYPLGVTIDAECDIAYIVMSRYTAKYVHIYDLSEGKRIDYVQDDIASYIRATVNPFTITLGDRSIQRRRSSASRRRDIQMGRFWQLYTQHHLYNTGLNFIEYVCVLRDDNLVFEHVSNDYDLGMILRLFGRDFTPEATFETALQAANPYAYALMYLAFKHGLWGTNESSILAELYKEGADNKTIEDAEKNLDVIRNVKKAVG